jgi:hypothetical protein
MKDDVNSMGTSPSFLTTVINGKSGFETDYLYSAQIAKQVKNNPARLTPPWHSQIKGQRALKSWL